MIGISSDKAFGRLCDALGNPEWAVDARFRGNADRVRNTPELDRLITDVLRVCPVSHWTAVLDRHDVANDPVQNPQQVMADRQTAALDQLARVELEGQEPALLPRLPLGLSLTPPEIQGPPPAVGEHTRAILREVGCTDAEIDWLIDSGACAAGS
jgi:crotonobetainyl-CoA:carnitine CoA-transferase CaiB-like acyl-CoA transferase